MLLHAFEENKMGSVVVERTLAFLYPFAIRGVLNSVEITRFLL